MTKNKKISSASNSISLLAYNFIGYQAIWFFTVWAVNNAHFLLPIPLTLLYVGSHLWLSKQRKTDIVTLITITTIGSITDMLFIHLNVFSLTEAQPVLYNIPFWLITIWLAFSQLLNYSLRWITTYPIFSILGGSIVGPMAYFAAVKFNLLTTVSPINFTMQLSFGWGILMVVIVLLLNLIRRKT